MVLCVLFGNVSVWLTERVGEIVKYSCCLYPKGSETLAQAERAMLESYVEKAQLKDGMSILDLG